MLPQGYDLPPIPNRFMSRCPFSHTPPCKHPFRHKTLTSLCSSNAAACFATILSTACSPKRNEGFKVNRKAVQRILQIGMAVSSPTQETLLSSCGIKSERYDDLQRALGNRRDVRLDAARRSGLRERRA